MKLQWIFIRFSMSKSSIFEYGVGAFEIFACYLCEIMIDYAARSWGIEYQREEVSKVSKVSKVPKVCPLISGSDSHRAPDSQIELRVTSYELRVKIDQQSFFQFTILAISIAWRFAGLTVLVGASNPTPKVVHEVTTERSEQSVQVR